MSKADHHVIDRHHGAIIQQVQVVQDTLIAYLDALEACLGLNAEQLPQDTVGLGHVMQAVIVQIQGQAELGQDKDLP